MVFKKKTDRGKGAIGRTPGKHRELQKHDNTAYNCDAKRRFCSDGNLHETVFHQMQTHLPGHHYQPLQHTVQ